MLGSYLRVIGKNFDVNAFLAKSEMVPYEDNVYHKGDTMGKMGVRKRGSPKRIWPYSGFSLVTNGVFGKLKPQIKGSLSFLRRYETELVKLSKNRDVESMRLIFTYCPGMGANVVERFPARLLAAAGKLGIELELSVYPGDNRFLETRRRR